VLLYLIIGRFQQILQHFIFYVGIYCFLWWVSVDVSDDWADSSDWNLETILYLASSQAPKSMSLHRSEQKGKNFACCDCSRDDILRILLQIGHLCFIRKISI